MGHGTALVAGQELPVMAQCDVLVCGGGPAGIAAAIASARQGASTWLVETLPHLGGTASGAGVGTACDTPGGPIFDELAQRLMEVGAARYRYDPQKHRKPGRLRYLPDAFKLMLLKMVREAGAQMLLCTTCEGAWVQDGAVRGAIVANKGQRSLIKAGVVVDATGDGDVAASCGAEFMMGDPADGRVQNANFRWGLGEADRERYEREKPSAARVLELVADARGAGRLHPPRGVFHPPPDSFPFDRESERLVLTNWEIQGVDGANPRSVSECLADCQATALELVEFCRRSLAGYENCRVTWLPTMLGIRESRRILGRYVVTEQDVLSGQKFDDTIARCWFWIDLHDPPPGKTVPYSLEHVKSHQPPGGDWYEIPYRALLPREVSGLLIAGRCISADRPAQSSLRVIPTCFFTGAAAGTAAAMAALGGIFPHELDGRLVREKLMPQ